MFPEYTLYYFDLEGRAEVIRLMLHAIGIPFTDLRFETEDWPLKYKPVMPLNKVPVLKVDDEVLCETSSIIRFLSKKYNLNGKTRIDAARCDAVLLIVDEYFSKLIQAFQVPPNESPARQQTFYDEEIPKSIALLEKLEQLYGKGGYIITDQLTCADLYVYYYFRTIHSYLRKEAKSEFVSRNKRTVESVPILKEYFANRWSIEDVWKIIDRVYSSYSQ
ncbi:hypothetical protein ACOME3_002318 [Neoechinorhynchus agilis]